MANGASTVARPPQRHRPQGEPCATTTRSTSTGPGCPPRGSGTIEVINASTEQVMGSIPEGTAEDVDKAVAAAKAAFETWGQTEPEERGKYIQRIAEGLGARSEEIAQVISEEMGMPLMWANMIQAGLPVGNMANYVEILSDFPWEERIGNSLVVREPIGVVGASRRGTTRSTRSSARSRPALAAGCTVVLKPSEVAPLDAFILAEVIDEVGLPAGVFNLVTGVGPVVGEAIAAHPDVDMVSFTGSTRAGKRVSRAGQRHGQAGRPRAGRQVRQHHPGRRRPGRGRAQGRVRLLPELGPDLHRPHPDARAQGEARRGRRHRRGRRRGLPGRPRRPGRRHARPALVGGPA